MQEIWKPVVGYEGLYEVSNLGNVKSLCDRQWNVRILRPWNRWWYLFVVLTNESIPSKKSVHRLVITEFIENIENKPAINHINWIKTDNRLENLEWCTHSENTIHSWNMWLSKITSNHNTITNHPTRWRFWKDSKSSKSINQYSKDNVFIKKWYSIIDVERELWIPNWNVSICCNWKRKTAGGFIWKYS